MDKRTPRADIKKLVAAYGGARKLADEMGVSVAAVYQWVRENSLPVARAMEFAEMLGGINPDALHWPWPDAPIVMDEEEVL